MNRNKCLTQRNHAVYNKHRRTMAKLDNYTLHNLLRKEDNMRYNVNSSMLVKDFVNTWLLTVKKKEVKAATYSRLEVSARTMADFQIADIKLSDIKSIDFRHYIQQLIDFGYAQSTIKKLMLIVSAPMEYAYREGVIPLNPCSAKLPSKYAVKKQQKEIEAYTAEEQSRLCTILRSRCCATYRAIEFMLETGLRIGEVLALQWDDVDTKRYRMRVHSTIVNAMSRDRAFIQEGAKSASSNRCVPLSVRACEILTELQNWKQGEFVFSGSKGNFLRYTTVRKTCKSVCRKANVQYYGLHVFRHTFATNQYYKGTDVKILSKLLGHANPSITYNVYIHLYGDGFEDMLNAVR